MLEILSNTIKVIEGNIFKTIIPLVLLSGEHDSEHDSEHDEIQIKSRKVLEFCKNPKTRAEIQDFLSIKSRSYISQNILNPLIKKDLLLLTFPDKPTSKKQKYYTN